MVKRIKGSKGLESIPRDRQGEARRTRYFHQMSTREIIGKLYERHDTGVWITTSIFLGVGLAVALFN
jgi:hypothetical protein